MVWKQSCRRLPATSFYSRLHEVLDKAGFDQCF